MLQTIKLPSKLSNLNKGMLPRNNYLEPEKNENDREEIRKNLNRRRAGNKVKSLDPNNNTENPKVMNKLEL